MRHRILVSIAGTVAALACGDSTGPDRNPVASIEIVAPSTRLLEGGVLQLTALAFDASGSPLDAVSVQWRSANTAVATVTADGEVRGLRVGSTDVIASAGRREQPVTVHVVARPVSCSAAGTVAVAVADSTVWRTADGPHHLTGVVPVTATLVIEPGALICGRQNGLLEIGTRGVLRAVGAPGDTIIFTAADPQVRWGGIDAVFGREIEIGYARIESARNGVQGLSATTTVVEDSRLADIDGVGISIGPLGAVRRTTISNARWGISLSHSSGAEIRGVVIRRPTEVGMIVWRARIALHDVRVEDSGGVGIGFAGLVAVDLTAASNLVVTRSAKAGITISSLQFTLTGCTVSDGSAEGVIVSDAQDVSIRGCNFLRNEGPGVLNGSFTTVDATLNWWGDPAGPNGPNGDGVSGSVTVMPVLTGPADMTGS
jgi:hypothetical protein